jgi:hypothetical protein
LTDDIAELTAELGIQPSFTPPAVLATRIATAETFGLHPIALKLADRYAIMTTPRRRITGIPVHCETPVTRLNHLSTRPINRYSYLQLRQRTIYPVTPVHTYAEYVYFKQNAGGIQFRKRARATNLPPHEAHKLIDFEAFAVHWNRDVHKQNQTEIDSNKRLYYKLPSHLERHYKRTLAWKSEQSTVMMGSNAEALQPFKDLLLGDAEIPQSSSLRELPGLPSGIRDQSFSQNGQSSLIVENRTYF